MKRVMRLTEGDLVRLVKRVIKENEETNCEGLKNEMATMFYRFKREVQNRKGRIYGHEVLHELNNLLYGPIEKAFDNKCDERDPDLITALGDQRKKYLFEYGVELGEIEPYK